MRMPSFSLSLKHLRALVVTGLTSLLGLMAHAAQQEVLIRFSHVVSPDTPKGQMAERFKQLVQQRSGGRLRVQVYPSSQLYGDDDEMEALRLGAVEMLAPSLSKFGKVGIPEFEVFDLPFLFNDFEQVRLVTHGPVGKQLLERLGRQQMVGLGFMDSGFKQMSAAKPLRTPEDFKGLRLRIQGSGVLVAQMRSLGARPVVLPFGETQRALANHVVDGAENSLSNFLTQDLARFQSDVTLTQHGYLGYAVVANPRFWASLSSAERHILQLALDDALELGNRLSAELDQEARKRLQSMPSVRLHELSPKERAALRQAVQPAYDSFERGVGRGVLQEVRRAVRP